LVQSSTPTSGVSGKRGGERNNTRRTTNMGNAKEQSEGEAILSNSKKQRYL